MKKLKQNIMIFSIILASYGCNAENIIKDDLIYLEKAKQEYSIKKKYTRKIIDDLESAANLGNDKAQESLGVAYADKKSNNYDYKKAIFWLKKQVDQGNIDATYVLAMVLLENDFVNEKDYLESENLFLIARNNGDLDAYEELSKMYYYAPKKIMNLNKAYKYSLDAAERKMSVAQLILGDFYYYGLTPVEKDIKKAIYWYELSANQKNTNALNSLALIYSSGKGVKSDNVKAIRYIDESYALNSSEAMYILGEAYLKGGFGLEVDKQSARSYFIEAIKNGNKKAEDYLNLIDE